MVSLVNDNENGGYLYLFLGGIERGISLEKDRSINPSIVYALRKIASSKPCFYCEF